MHSRSPITIITSPDGITSPVATKTVLPTRGAAPPVQYRIEERRRTVYVSSAVPPEQWDPDTVKGIFKLADISESDPAGVSAASRRTQSVQNRDAQEGSSRVYGHRRNASRSELSLGVPNRDTPPETPTRTTRGSPRTPGTPLRQTIFFYHKHDPHYGFTNFSPHPVTYKGKRYPTSEHLFQSFKFQEHRPNLAEHIRTFSERPSVAFSEARRFQPEVRNDWMKVNIPKMDETLWHKFTQHPDLKAELLDTGDAELVEDSDKDAFWGIGADRRGRNELGRALERLRAVLREA